MQLLAACFEKPQATFDTVSLVFSHCFILSLMGACEEDASSTLVQTVSEKHETHAPPRKLFRAPLVTYGFVGDSRPVLSVEWLGFRGSAMMQASTVSYGCYVRLGLSA